MWLDPSRAERRRLVETRAIVTHPSFSPDGRRVVFFQGKALDHHLWTSSTSGSELRQLTFQEGGDVLPEWSADGKWIHYYRLRPPSFRRIPAEGGEAEVLVEGWRFPSEHGADVDADNRRVVYTTLERGAATSARVRDLASGEEHLLATAILWPRWSPDGTRIVGRAADRDLVVCPASGEPCRSLGVEGTEPRWSDDGLAVYFVRYSDYHGSRESRAVPLYRIGLDGSPAVLVAELEGPSPSHFFYDVSTNGEIAWASFVPGRQELWLAELPPGGLR
jgi:hypothetical protein